jgi:hypothetical protein
MHHSRAGRIIAICASICLLLVLGCGLLGLGIRQGAVTPPDIDVQLGPLVITTLGPRSFNCPLQNGPSMNVCDGLRIVPRLAAYRIWLLWDAPRRGTESVRTLAEWTVPVRQQ